MFKYRADSSSKRGQSQKCKNKVASFSRIMDQKSSDTSRVIELNDLELPFGMSLDLSIRIKKKSAGSGHVS
jgi:hypothetical protein